MSSSSSRRRARSSRGVLTGTGGCFAVFGRAVAFALTCTVRALAAGRAFLSAAFFFAAGLFGAGFFVTGFLAADFFRAAEGFFRGRTAGRLLVLPAEIFGDRRVADFRLAMSQPFCNLDSVAITIVLSAAYRKSRALHLGSDAHIAGCRHPRSR